MHTYVSTGRVSEKHIFTHAAWVCTWVSDISLEGQRDGLLMRQVIIPKPYQDNTATVLSRSPNKIQVGDI